MSKQPLSIIKTKINRAKTQIDDLEKEIRSFIEHNSHYLEGELNLDGTEEIWRFKLTNTDTSLLSVMAGEIGHNLRTALDNIVCEIAYKHSGRRDRTYFPFGKTVDAFETSVSKKTKDLPADAVDLIRALKPYKGGNDLLWAIHDMNRDDKHPGLTAVGGVQGMMMSGLKVFSGQVLIMGSRHGQHLVVDGYKPKFFAVELMREEGEVLTTTPGTKFQLDAQPTFQISFRDIKGFERKPIVAVLHQMRDLVESIVLTFEKRFF